MNDHSTMPGGAPLPAGVPLPAGARDTLRRVAAMMIPASTRFGVPGADDDAIFGDILRSLDRDAPAVREALDRLDILAGGRFAAADEAAAGRAVQRLREEAPALESTLVAVVVRCYYRDDRVMRSLGMEPRAPYPKGFDVPQGDWSLLDPVRARGPIWRRVPSAGS